jgi:hypothetical protein
VNARALAQDLARYRMPSLGRSIVEILITIVPFLALWTSMWAALDIGYWLSLLLALPAAGFLVRLFMIQHDPGVGRPCGQPFSASLVSSVSSEFTKKNSSQSSLRH